ncbi:amino acid ABC transporter permease [Marinobacterium litorale]|jgi:ectoine/hydroxyectoine ABC transporter permease protein EhuC|uniref:amino acid ABC transporter permease n=1 Tax=Marinobacterium litorale TaxID=404770 RepID=UPI00041167BD|nr:amino acid ABC transporter permease [Marinobacterium litorale]
MFDWAIIVKYLPILSEAALLTLYISVISLVLGLVFGLAAALARLSRNRLFYGIASFYIWLIRSTPLLVQLFLIYYGLPQFGLDLSPFVSGVLGLALNVGAYNAETIRGGIQSISHGQTEAALSIGMNHAQTMRRIILPQAVRNIIPPLGNNFIILIKDTSLVSTITLVELTMKTQQLVGTTYKPFELYLAATMLYAVMTTATAMALRVVEKRMHLKTSRR